MKLNFTIISILLLTQSAVGGGFVDEDGKILRSYGDIWNFVNRNVGNCPEKILFKGDRRKDGFSRFVGNPPAVIIAKDVGHKDFKMIFAHETSHVCLARKTNQMSNQERFRFFDEGLADIIGVRFVGGEDSYKRKAFKRAKAKVANGEVSFKQIQNWKSYFGSPPKVDFDAYMVGATFNYFLAEKFGQSKMNQFFQSIGQTQNLSKSLKNVFGADLKTFERQWIQYIKSN